MLLVSHICMKITCLQTKINNFKTMPGFQLLEFTDQNHFLKKEPDGITPLLSPSFENYIIDTK